MYYENNNDAVNVLACACALRRVTTTVVVVRSTGGCDPKTAAVPPMAGALTAGGSCHMATASRARRAAVVRHGTHRRRRVGLAREPDAHARTRRTRATRACTGSWPRVITSTTSVRGRVVERGGLVSIVARGAPSTDPPPIRWPRGYVDALSPRVIHVPVAVARRPVRHFAYTPV